MFVDDFVRKIDESGGSKVFVTPCSIGLVSQHRQAFLVKAIATRLQDSNSRYQHSHRPISSCTTYNIPFRWSFYASPHVLTTPLLCALRCHVIKCIDRSYDSWRSHFSLASQITQARQMRGSCRYVRLTVFAVLADACVHLGAYEQ